jgi:hypothetical protein
LQERRGPSPGGDDSRCHKTRFHSSSSRAEHLGGLQLIVVTLEDPCNKDLSELVIFNLFLELVDLWFMSCDTKHLVLRELTCWE